jgi:hypothetical protein
MKEEELKGKGLKRTVQVLKKGKERVIDVEEEHILRESIWEENRRIEGKMSVL